MSKLELSKEIYKYSDLVNCCNAYLDFAKTDVRDDGEYWIVVFTDCKFDEIETLKEFENYLIELSFGSSAR